MKPVLRQLRSIKIKLSIVIVAAVFVTAVSGLVGVRVFHLSPYFCALLAAVFALLCVQVLARGMTKPLREMAVASKAMAEGDHEQRVAVTTRDELGELAAAFNAMAEQVHETDQLRRNLVANISHDLRTPVAALQVTLENLVDGVQKADQHTTEAMLKQTHRLGNLVNQLLDLSRLEANSIDFYPEPMAVKPLLNQVLADAQIVASEKNVHISCHMEPETVQIMGDHTCIYQLVTNLLENAVRFSPREGEIQIVVREQREKVQISVSDQGPGIPQNEVKRVFERFYRLDHARAADGGAGLGLSIVKWIVDLHEGNVCIEPVQPNGTRFVVLLPKGLQ